VQADLSKMNAQVPIYL